MGLLSVAAGWIGLGEVEFSEAAISSAGFLESDVDGAVASATSVPGPSWSESALSAAGGVVCAASRGRATWSAIFRRPAFHSRAAALYRVEYRLVVRRVVRREAYRAACTGAERAVRRETPEAAELRCTPDRCTGVALTETARSAVSRIEKNEVRTMGSTRRIVSITSVRRARTYSRCLFGFNLV